MENMNLASRCREAIAQVASLKKEMVVYQKRQSEWGTLQREVMALRKQIDKNAAASNHSRSNSSDSLQQSLSTSPDKALQSSGDPTTTDLDRIMSQHLQKEGKASSNSAVEDAPMDEKDDDTTGNNLSKTFQDLLVSPTSAAASSSVAKQKQPNVASSNTKIPISVNSTKPRSNSDIKDDEFDADIDMVDFFAQSQQQLQPASTTPHKPKKGEDTDDHMPSDGISPGGGSSPKINDNKKPSPASNGSGPENLLLSSLDAFEASFASAFPETSFSITSNPTPLSMPAKLDMSFEVPDFDPFFKSPKNNCTEASSVGSLGSGNSANRSSGGGTSLKSQMMADVFPESAMTNLKPTTSMTPKLDDIMTFDSNPINTFAPTMESPSEMSSKKLQSKGKGNASHPSSLDSNKEDNTAPQKSQRAHRAPQPLSPQTMTAEIEQLDVIANLASSENNTSSNPETKGNASLTPSSGNSTPSAANNRTATAMRASSRKAKQPVSYAEPSTKSKLRRGDVLFPKVDAEKKNKLATSNKGGLLGGKRASTGNSHDTDLDRIMGQMTDGNV